MLLQLDLKKQPPPNYRPEKARSEATNLAWIVIGILFLTMPFWGPALRDLLHNQWNGWLSPLVATIALLLIGRLTFLASLWIKDHSKEADAYRAYVKERDTLFQNAMETVQATIFPIESSGVAPRPALGHEIPGTTEEQYYVQFTVGDATYQLWKQMGEIEDLVSRKTIAGIFDPTPVQGVSFPQASFKEGRKGDRVVGIVDWGKRWQLHYAS